eukprot:TRINITY_DN30062_c0_g1_i1.p1 TRINITY_DN30062_c0_g1~~TRINITY_DN30062_c0_g1_i1.p1  ORF type:complete len:112 (+),score=21.11 TRINITY_DN30062_c0_g1_i1:2-337(+)
MRRLGVETAGELAGLSSGVVEGCFPGQSGYLIGLASGDHNEPVQDRALVKSLGNSKTFFGSSALQSNPEARHWLSQLACELHVRYQADLSKNRRAPRSLTLTVHHLSLIHI